MHLMNKLKEQLSS